MAHQWNITPLVEQKQFTAHFRNMARELAEDVMYTNEAPTITSLRQFVETVQKHFPECAEHKFQYIIARAYHIFQSTY